jgi:outer membrane immunogenic protein
MKKLLIAGVAAAALCGAPALAADMAVKAPPQPPAPVAGWTGFYVGGEIGAQWDNSRWNTTCIAGFAACPLNGVFPGFLANNNPAAFNSTGFRGGLFAGYDLQVSPQWVIGVEGDFGGGSNNRTIAGIPGTLGGGLAPNLADQSSVKGTWDASAVGRVGYLITPTVMVFGVGGLSWLHEEASASCAPAPAVSWCVIPADQGTTQMTSSTRSGWTAGGGFEYMVLPNWLVRGEYRYADYGSFGSTFFAANPVDAVIFNVHTRVSSAQFGVAYKFGGH